ncbi:AAA family ATPase [Aurantiacibacter sp. MUD61]|uniref:AAA family ATPase n=1 Tax=Aurantiacibacter sp. MUD61 TaxID=3009083 RepID=UPI0022F08593|nr:hypothetical protein [Aurantiacibacter sp. MUD61]
MKNMLELSKEAMVGKALNSVVIADQKWIDQIEDDESDLIASLQFIPCDARSSIEASRLGQPDIVVLEVDGGEPATIDRVAEMQRRYPNASIIAAVASADLKVMRALLRYDVSDAVALPFDTKELTAEICNIAARRAEPKKETLAPTVAITGALARSGATSILIHLADVLAASMEKTPRICLIDLDIQSGQLSSYTGVEVTRSVADLLEAGERLDGEMVRNVSSQFRDNIRIISAPGEIFPMEQLGVDQILRIVSLARSQFDLVLIDLPAVWTNWSLSLATEASSLVLVIEQTLPHLRQTRRCLDLFREVGLDTSRISLVVNRAKKSRFANISVQDVADTLGVDVAAAIREDRGALSEALDQGMLVYDGSNRNPFGEGVREFAHLLRDSIWRADI